MAYIHILVFLIALAFGSFLNVCIYRIPLHMSLIKPASHCPFCGKKIKFYDNIPLISYIVLGGKCRYCGHRIPIRYPIVELLTALLIYFAFLKFGLSFLFFKSAVFILIALCLGFIDMDKQIVPDVITLPAIAAGLIFSLYPGKLGIKQSIIGIIAGALVILLFIVAGKLVFKREAMGSGDLTFMAFVGAFWGIGGVFFTILFSSIIGSVFGVILYLIRKNDIIPYGPFISVGALIYIYWILSNYYLTIA